MSADDFDPVAFRKLEHDGWNALYTGYHDHWAHLTPQIIPEMLRQTAVGPGKRVLDIASGPGYVAGAAAAAGADVSGIDLADNMRRLAAANYPQVSFQLGDAEDLPFDDQAFDVVLINFGILHFPNAEVALTEAFRVLRVGGRLGFTAWAASADSAIGIAMKAIEQEGALEVDLPKGTPTFRFADHAECAEVLARAGFADITSTDIMLRWRLPAPDALMSSFRQATARISALLGAQNPDHLPAIAKAMAQGCAPYAGAEFTELPMPAVLTCATKAE